MSYESVIRAWDAGAPTFDQWASMTVMGWEGDTDAGEWSVVVATETGDVFRIDLDSYSDIAWEYWEFGDYWGYDHDKDIDTGGPDTPAA